MDMITKDQRKFLKMVPKLEISLVSCFILLGVIAVVLVLWLRPDLVVLP